MYVGHHVVGVGEAQGSVAAGRLVHRLDANVSGRDVARFLGRAVRVAEPGGRGASHRVTAPVERFVERRRRRRSVRVKPHMHGPEVVVDLDPRTGRLFTLQVHELGGFDRGQSHAEVWHRHRVPRHPVRRKRRLAAGRRRIRHDRRYQ